MTTSRAPKQPVRFALPQDVPPLARAASLALAVARHCKASSWAEFVERLEADDTDTILALAGLEVDDADSALVAEHDHVLRLLKVKPMVTVAVCPTCGGWALVSSGAAPTKCKTTMRCTGTRPVKASVATKEKPA